jgi:hypothetical protein
MLANFVLETASAPGTASPFNLAGAATGRIRFRDAFATTATALYVMEDGTQGEWGYGTLTHASPDTLTRTVIGNTAGTTARLNFASTTRVYCWLPAERALWLDAAGLVQNVTAANLRASAAAPLTLIERQTASSSASIDFVIPAGYARHELVFSRVVLATNNASLWLRASVNAGSSYLAGTEYAWGATYNDATATGVGNAANGAAQAVISGGASNASNLTIAGRYDLDVGSGSLRASLHGGATMFDNAASVMLAWKSSASIAAGADVDAVRFLASSGNIASGIFELWGVD